MSWVPCEHCEDSGILAIEHEGFETYAICDFTGSRGTCVQGAWQIWKLPKISELGFMKNKPLDWRLFKPSGYKTGECLRYGVLWERVSWWKETIRISEHYWASHEPKQKNLRLLDE